MRALPSEPCRQNDGGVGALDARHQANAVNGGVQLRDVRRRGYGDHVVLPADGMQFPDLGQGAGCGLDGAGLPGRHLDEHVRPHRPLLDGVGQTQGVAPDYAGSLQPLEPALDRRS